MSIRVLFFGKLADTANNELGSISLDIDENPALNTVAALTQHLTSMSPALGKELTLQGNLFTVNQTICKENAMISAGDEVAFMSPLSGG